MTMNPFEQSTQQLLRFLTSNAEQEVIDYIRQEMQHDAPDSIPTEEELFAFFQSPDAPTELDTLQGNIPLKRHLGNFRMSNRNVVDPFRIFYRLKIMGTDSNGSYILCHGFLRAQFQIIPV